MKDHQVYNDQLFSRWAPVYDGFELILSGVRKRVVQEIDPAGKSVLDVATGTGSLAIALSSKADKVVGIDLSSKMLEVANKKIENNSKVSFLQMDASKMSFQDHEFDIVTISLGLHDMPPDIRNAVVNEAKRILKNDGKLYVLEYDQPRNKMLGSVSRNLINTFESKYYIGFLKQDLAAYLGSFGLTVDNKISFLFHHLQLLTLSKE